MYQNIFVANRTEDQQTTVYIWDDDKGLLVFPYSDFDYAYKLDNKHGDKETIFGDLVSKTYNWPDNARNIYESDVPRETRVLTDMYLNSDEVSKNHHVLVFDIEVDSTGGFASVERADKEVTAIGCYAQADDKYVVFLLDKSGQLERSRILGNETVYAFPTESELLSEFLSFYNEYKPTILTGWNIIGYDIPYLYHRLRQVFDADTANMLSPIGMIKYSKHREQYQIAGVSALDYFEMYQKFTYSRRPSYRLGAIGMYEVGMDKIKYDGSLDLLYKTDVHKFIEYNLQDVRIVVALDKKMKLINLILNVSHVGHTQYEDYKYSSKFIDGTILTYLHRQGKVVPNRKADGQAEMDARIEDGEEGFTGAYVKEPVPGLYEWVYNLDLQSLYPSIIMSLNISPETKIGKVRNWNLEDHIKGTGNTYVVDIFDAESVLTREQFILLMEKEKFQISSNGIIYRSDKLGIIPEILDKWFSERAEYKGLMKKYKKEGNEEQADYYDRRQHVQKILLNSIYGVLGLPIFRFYDLDNALAVTATGQDVIKTSAKFVNNHYQRELNTKDDYCIYIDTDSLYFSSLPLLVDKENGVKVNTIDVAREVEGKLNKFYDVMAKKMFYCEKHRFLIKGEAVSETVFWVTKKRYGMYKVYDLESNIDFAKPKLTIKGLDIIRSSFPIAYQTFMTGILESILQKTGKVEIDEKVTQFRSDMNSMNFVDIARNTAVNNISEHDDKKERGYQKFPKGISAHVKASIAYNRWLRINKLDKTYEVIRDHDKIKWVYLKDNPLKLATIAMRGFEDPPALVEFVTKYLDIDMLFESELEKKLGDFYSALSWGLLPMNINKNAEKFFSF